MQEDEGEHTMRIRWTSIRIRSGEKRRTEFDRYLPSTGRWYFVLLKGKITRTQVIEGDLPFFG